MSLLPGDATTTITMRALPSMTAEPEPPPPTNARPAVDETWTVEPGDSFWSIAQEVLIDNGLAHPDDEEIADYWRRLVVANRDRLASPAHPDLLFPGQIMRLPAP
jgi:nucleoid-associated protein YgaU